MSGGMAANGICVNLYEEYRMVWIVGGLAKKKKSLKTNLDGLTYNDL